MMEPDLRSLYDNLVDDRQRRQFHEEWQLCFSRHWEDIGRCRISVYLRAGVYDLQSGSARRRSAPPANLAYRRILEELTRLTNGLILVTGPTGMGKTTTLNFMINAINSTRRAKIITIEDPVEFATRTI